MILFTTLAAIVVLKISTWFGMDGGKPTGFNFVYALVRNQYVIVYFCLFLLCICSLFNGPQ